MNQDRVYFGCVKEVHSGDDLIILVDLGVDGLYKKVRARLKGVDAPDAYKEDSATEAGKIRDTVKSKVLNSTCKIELHAEKRSVWIITLWAKSDDGDTSLNQYLMDLGYTFTGARSTNG